MHIETIRIHNFRRLKDVRIDFASDISIFVGANNSGKTSATEAVEYFVRGARDAFAIHDFNAESWAAIDAFGDVRTPIRASTAQAVHNRPDRWQHPTTCQNLSNTSCAEGGVHRWTADLRLRPVQPAMP
jgi:AAA ATPase domain